MKVRIGVGMGAAPLAPASSFGAIVDDLDRLGFDSIWLPEVLTAPTLDPLAGLAFAAARNPHLKLGTTVLLPGRNVVRLAKQLATLDVLSSGRLLATFVPGLPRRHESGAVGVARPDKARLMEEMIPLLRRLWAGEQVTHDGDAGRFDDVVLAPLPVQQPLEVWTGGMVPDALTRCGRLADGWLPSACTPEEVAGAREVVDNAASKAGRAISPEHFGVSIAYSAGPLDARQTQALATLRRGVDPSKVVPVGISGLPRHDRGLPRRGILQVRGPTPRDPAVVAGRARSSGRRGAGPPDVTRSRPVELEFVAHDDPELLACMAEVAVHRTGWINVEPVIEDEHVPPGPGPFAFLGGSTHKVPTITWMPGRRASNGTVKPTTVGLQHAAGPRLAWKLRDIGLPLPDGWRVTQDHPRRGLVAQVPADADDRAVIDWLLAAATFACAVPTTGRWTASIHAGLA